MTKTKTFVPLLVELEEALARSTAPQVQAAMLLLVYCNKKRNGGRIPRALVEDRMELGMLILAGLYGALEHDCELFHWDGDTLVVDCYSVAHEEKAAKNAERMAELSEARWKRRKTNRKASAKGATHSDTYSDTHSDTECRQDEINSLSKDRESLFLSRTSPDCESDSSGSSLVTETAPSRPPQNAGEVMTDEELTAGFNEIKRELN